MARLYFDHNVSRHVGPFLWAADHDLLFTREPGAAKLPDDVHLLSAVHANRILITHNRRDFRMLHDAWVTWPAAFGMALPPHPGVPILDSAPYETLAQVLAMFLAETPRVRLPNGIFWWHRHDGWRQPIAGAKWEPYEVVADAEPE